MTYMLGPCSVKGCSRHHGVTVIRRPGTRSAVDLSADSATGDRRERGAPGRRSRGIPHEPSVPRPGRGRAMTAVSSPLTPAVVSSEQDAAKPMPANPRMRGLRAPRPGDSRAGSHHLAPIRGLPGVRG